MEPIIFNLDNHTIEIRITRTAKLTEDLPPDADEILAVVELVTRIPRNAIRGKGRTRETAEARQLAALLMSENRIACRKIVKCLNRGDTSTVNSEIRTARNLVDLSPAFRIRHKRASEIIASASASCGIGPCRRQETPSPQPSEQAFCPLI